MTGATSAQVAAGTPVVTAGSVTAPVEAGVGRAVGETDGAWTTATGGTGVCGVGLEGHGLTIARASPATMARITIRTGSKRRRRGATVTGSKSMLTGQSSRDRRGWPWGSAREGHDPAIGIDRRLAPEPLELGARYLVAGVVARSHERPRFDVLEAKRESGCLHLGELVGVVVALEREVLERRAQVLPDGQDVAVDRAERLEGFHQLVARLAEPDHQRALGVDRVADLAGHRLGGLEDAEAPLPARALADRPLEAPDGLVVV